MNASSPEPAQSSTPPWRYLVLDRSDPSDPHWAIAVVQSGADVLPAELGPGEDIPLELIVADRPQRPYERWQQVTSWVRLRLGNPRIALTPASTLVWHLSEDGRPR